MRLRVDYVWDEQAKSWGFSVPALHITGGGCRSRQIAERHCLDAIAFALQAPDGEAGSTDGERVEYQVTVTAPSGLPSTARVPEVVAVHAVPPFGLHLRFADGVEGNVDLADDLWGEMFEPLKDPEYFARVRVGEDGAPEWPNGLDVDPCGLYADVIRGGRR